MVNAFNKVEGARDDGVKGIHEVQQKGTIARPSGSWLPSNAIGVWLLQSMYTFNSVAVKS